MKFNKRFKIALLAVLAIVAFVIALGLLPQPPQAQAQPYGNVEPTTIIRLTNWPSQITTAVASNINTVVRVPQGKVIQFQLAFAANNTTTDPLIVWWQPSVDGTNYQTAERIFSTAANGTTVVTGGGKIAATDSEGWRFIKFTVASNASARTFITTNAVLSWK